MIVYSQITGISPYQKKQLIKGLKAEAEYKKVIRNQDKIISYKDSIIVEDKKEIQALNNQLDVRKEELDISRIDIRTKDKEIKGLKVQVVLWKGVSLVGAGLATYTTIRWLTK